MGAHLMCASKKAISSHQIHRMLGVTYKSAWFVTHRIREAMKPGSIGLLGTGGDIVEADETYRGNQGKQRKGVRGYQHKMKVVSLVERGGPKAFDRSLCSQRQDSEYSPRRERVQVCEPDDR